MKTRLYLVVVVLALLALALGGFLVRGAAAGVRAVAAS
jgi:hypothetical protein